MQLYSRSRPRLVHVNAPIKVPCRLQTCFQNSYKIFFIKKMCVLYTYTHTSAVIIFPDEKHQASHFMADEALFANCLFEY